MTNNPIEELLQAAQAQVAAIDREIAGLQHAREIAVVQVAAYERARDAVNASRIHTVDSPSPSEHTVIVRPRAGSVIVWPRVMRYISTRFPEDFGYEDIISGAKAVGILVNRNSLRTRMMNYANDGVVKRVDNGRFKFTLKGRLKFKIDGADAPPNENGEAEASPDADEAPTSSTHSEELDELFR